MPTLTLQGFDDIDHQPFTFMSVRDSEERFAGEMICKALKERDLGIAKVQDAKVEDTASEFVVVAFIQTSTSPNIKEAHFIVEGSDALAIGHLSGFARWEV